MSSEDAPSFATEIRPLFRDEDRNAMAFAFDLWSYDDVSEHADAILSELETGAMPCDGDWPDADVATVRAWIAAGKPE